MNELDKDRLRERVYVTEEPVTVTVYRARCDACSHTFNDRTTKPQALRDARHHFDWHVKTIEAQQKKWREDLDKHL